MADRTRSTVLKRLSGNAMTAPALLAPGTLLRNRYEIRREIGRGGYSIVYQAHDRDVGSDVAVKLLVPPPATAHLARERLRREVHAVRGLSHGNIVAVYDLLDEEPWSYIIMEYVAGPDLAIRVRERGPLSPEEAVRVGRDIAAALAAAHRRGILHRDVKPQNILLDPDGRARLTDFGSAKLDGQLGITATGALAGTLAYAAPEIARRPAGRCPGRRLRAWSHPLLRAHGHAARVVPPATSRTTPAPEGHRPAAVNPGVPAWLDGRRRAGDVGLGRGSRYPTAAALDEALAAAAPHAGALSATNAALSAAGAIRSVSACAPPAAELRRARPTRWSFCSRRGGAPSVTPSRLDSRRSCRRRRVRKGRPSCEASAPSFGRRSRGRGVSSRRWTSGTFRARSLPVARAWSAVPGTYKTMVLATAIAGFGAGAAVAPVLLWTTPLVGGLLLLGAHQAVRRPLVARPERRGELPPELEDKVVRTLAELPDGSARGLLADVTRLAHSLFARLRRTGDDRRLTPALTDLVASACAAAADLAMLDENLSRLRAAAGAGGLASCRMARRARRGPSGQGTHWSSDSSRR